MADNAGTAATVTRVTPVCMCAGTTTRAAWPMWAATRLSWTSQPSGRSPAGLQVTASSAVRPSSLSCEVHLLQVHVCKANRIKAHSGRAFQADGYGHFVSRDLLHCLSIGSSLASPRCCVLPCGRYLMMAGDAQGWPGRGLRRTASSASATSSWSAWTGCVPKSSAGIFPRCEA